MFLFEFINIMKPLSSFLCFSLKTSTKLVCKSYLVIVAMTMTINILKLDYEGQRKESMTALGLVFLFIVFLTGAAFAGHSGADREALCLVTTSLGLMVFAIILWIGLGIVSMQKGDPNTIWHVCLENRCTETFWTLDFSYRNSTSLSKDSLQSKKRKQPTFESKYGDIFQTSAVLSVNGSEMEEMESQLSIIKHLSDNYVGDGDNEEFYGEIEERQTPKRVLPNEPKTFWSRITGSDETPYQDRKSGISLLITLVFFFFGFVYFFICVTIVCSYSAELYEEYSSYETEDEDEDKRFSLL